MATNIMKKMTQRMKRNVSETMTKYHRKMAKNRIEKMTQNIGNNGQKCRTKNDENGLRNMTQKMTKNSGRLFRPTVAAYFSHNSMKTNTSLASFLVE